MRALFIQHDHVSPTGPVGDAFRHCGFEIDELLVVPAERHGTPSVTVEFPDPSGYDVVVPMGAPWSVYDTASIGSWIGDELAMLRAAVANDVPVLGICFGGQALAAALGGGVERADRTEIGWTEVRTTRPDLVAPGPWFEWHRDRWTLPPGAHAIAWSDVSEQAFVAGRSLGVQFHPELTPAMLDGWLANGGEAYLEALAVDAEGLRQDTARRAAAAAGRAAALVEAFLQHVRAAARTPGTPSR